MTGIYARMTLPAEKHELYCLLKYNKLIMKELGYDHDD